MTFLLESRREFLENFFPRSIGAAVTMNLLALPFPPRRNQEVNAESNTFSHFIETEGVEDELVDERLQLLQSLIEQALVNFFRELSTHQVSNQLSVAVSFAYKDHSIDITNAFTPSVQENTVSMDWFPEAESALRELLAAPLTRGEIDSLVVTMSATLPNEEPITVETYGYFTRWGVNLVYQSEPILSR